VLNLGVQANFVYAGKPRIISEWTRVFLKLFSRQASDITWKKLVYSSVILCFDYINSSFRRFGSEPSWLLVVSIRQLAKVKGTLRQLEAWEQIQITNCFKTFRRILRFFVLKDWLWHNSCEFSVHELKDTKKLENHHLFHIWPLSGWLYRPSMRSHRTH